MNMDEILKTFIAESEELLQQMEAALLQILHQRRAKQREHLLADF